MRRSTFWIYFIVLQQLKKMKFDLSLTSCAQAFEKSIWFLILSLQKLFRHIKLLRLFTILYIEPYRCGLNIQVFNSDSFLWLLYWLAVINHVLGTY